MKKYPRFGEVFKKYNKCHPNNRPTCECCGEPAICRIWIQVNWMRGEDEDFKVCQDHLDLAKSEPAKLYEVYDTFTRGQTEGDGKTGYGEKPE